jgi:hypothetical protein
MTLVGTVLAIGVIVGGFSLIAILMGNILCRDIKDWLKLSPVKEMREAAENKLKEEMGDTPFEIVETESYYGNAQKQNGYVTSVFVRYNLIDGKQGELEHYLVDPKTFEVTDPEYVKWFKRMRKQIQKKIDECDG